MFGQPLHKDFTTCVICGCHHEGTFEVLDGELRYESACSKCVRDLSEVYKLIEKAHRVSVQPKTDN